jgi:hypothetical protein
MFVPSQCIDADIQKLNIETHVQRNKILTVYYYAVGMLENKLCILGYQNVINFGFENYSESKFANIMQCSIVVSVIMQQR